MQASKTEVLTILHFNDCYNIEERAQEPVGGVARFHTAVHSFDKLNPLVLFSGDLYAPSTLSKIYSGKQIIKPINMMGIHAALYGNHDFDYNEEILLGLSQENNFPWLFSNVTWLDGTRVANGKEYLVIDHCGHRVISPSLVGLIEYDWLPTLPGLPIDALNYTDFVKKGKELSQKLKSEEKCDLVIALTHMRTNNDYKLAREVPEIELILGGHDHVFEITRINDTYVIKSGTDFRQLGFLQLRFPTTDEILEIKKEMHSKIKAKDLLHGKFTFKAEVLDVTKKYEPCPELKDHVDESLKEFSKLLDKNIGYLDEEFDTRFSKIRSEETNATNFFADLIRLSLDADIAIVNTGLIRADSLYPKGFLLLKDIMAMQPYTNPLTKLEVTGETLIKVLENGVSKLPVLDGRFPVISGMSLEVEKSKPPGERVVVSSVKIQGKPIDLKQYYTVAAPIYIAQGKDGYDILTSQKRTFDDSETPYFLDSEVIKFFDLRKDPKFMEFYNKKNIKRSLSLEQIFEELDYKRNASSELRLPYYEAMTNLISRMVEDNGEWFIAVAPKTDNRLRYI